VEQLRDKIAVITGGASGIGRALAERFGSEGMKLVLADIEPGPLEEAAAKLEAAGCEVLAVPTNVADAEQMDALGARALERFGAVHVVCNNAGVGGGGQMWDLTTKDWEWVLGPNLWGVIHGVRVFGRHLVDQNEGHFVNTASMAGLVSIPNMGPYNVTKHSVVTLSETLWAELQNAGSEVGVSVLCPGFVNTRIFESDRNRPDELRNPEAPPETPEVLERRKMMAAFMQQAMPTEAVAEQVLDAVRTKRFYILTHDGARDGVAQRMQAIIDGKNPPLRDPTEFARK